MRYLNKVIVVVILVCLTFATFPQMAYGATITVTNNLDSGSGSLREAINSANASSGADTILFDSSLAGTKIYLLSQLPDITGALNITNNLSTAITVDGSRIVANLFTVNNAEGFTMQNITVSNSATGLVVNVGGLAEITNCTFTNNSAVNGGAIFNSGTLTVNNCTFSNNKASGTGGGIFNESSGILTVNNSTFSGNSTKYGGGLFIEGTVTLKQCTISGNVATKDGGGIYDDAIATAATINECTISNNTSSRGGGLFIDGFATNLTNCTIIGNHASFGGSGLFHASNGSVLTNCLTNCTFVDNNDTGILSLTSGLIIRNSILWDETHLACLAGVTYSDIRGSCTGVGNISADPKLGPLGDYGGPVQTVPLLNGSPAIDAVTGGTNPAIDARGVSRPFGANCDMGAFESQGFTLTATTGTPQTTTINTAFAAPLGVAVTSADGVPVDGSQVTFTAPASGASAVLTGSPASTSGGAASVTAVANSTAGGPYNVTASMNGAASINFSLTNVPPADLSITKTHTGDFVQGQTGATYTITVTNIGSGSSSGTTTVTDLLPSGLTAASFSGTGWTCSAAGQTLTATRSDALAPGASYQSLTAEVNIASSVPAMSTVTNTVIVTMPGDSNPANNTSTDMAIIQPSITPPSALNSTISTTSAAFDRYGGSVGYQDIPVTMTLNGNSLVNIKNGANLLTAGTDYTTAGSIVTIKKAYLAALPTGSAILTFHFSAGTDATLNISIMDTTPQSNNNSGGGNRGSGDNSTPGPVNATIGWAHVYPGFGGKISLGNAAFMTLPAGAVKGSQPFKVEIVMIASPHPAPSGFKILGNAYEFRINGQNHYNFDIPVTLTFAFEPSAVPAGTVPSIFYYDTESKKWIELGGVISGNTITVTVDHFTTFAVMAEKQLAKPVFKDVAAGYWAAGSIEKLAEMGVINGYTDDTFRPESYVTRAEFISMLVKALKLQNTDYGTVGGGKGTTGEGTAFKDISGCWAKDSIVIAEAHGIVDGYPDKNFRPQELVCREEIAAIALRAAGIKPADGKPAFADSREISPWAKNFVLAMVNNGFLKVYQDNTFRPKNHFTRAEAADVILRLVQQTLGNPN